jgi:hypothetical protein
MTVILFIVLPEMTDMGNIISHIAIRVIIDNDFHLKNNRILGIFATNGTNRHERIGKFREFVHVVDPVTGLPDGTVPGIGVDH